MKQKITISLILLVFATCTLLMRVDGSEEKIERSYPEAVEAEEAIDEFTTIEDRVIIKFPPNINDTQRAVLHRAFEIAVADGNPQPEVFQAILMQETKAGGMRDFRVAGHSHGLKPMERYYGLGQVKLAAALDVLRKYPNMHRFGHTGKLVLEEEIIALLILNDEFNMQIASKYYMILGPDSATTDQKITAYNQGWRGSKRVNPKTWHYTVGVRKHLALINGEI